MAVDSGLIIPVDFDITKAEAKQRKLNREMDISRQKAENINSKIQELNISLEDEKNKQKEIRDQISEQTKEAALLAQQIDKVKSGNATMQEIIDLGSLDAAEAKLKEMEAAIIKNEQAFDKSAAAEKKITAEIAKQNLNLKKQNANTANIGDQIILNGKKQNKFTQALEKSQKSAERFGKRIKSLIASALFFSVITKAFTALRNEFGKLITETGTRTASLVTQLKSNLAVLGRTLYESARPYIEWILEKLVHITQLITEAMAKALGKNVQEMKKLAQQTEKTGKEAKGATAGFDQINVLSQSSTDDSNSRQISTTTDSIISDEELKKTEKQLDEILELVGKIALGFLTWKISRTFLGDLGGITSAIGVTLIADAFCDLKDGLDLKDIVEGALGGALFGANIGFKLGGWPGALGGAMLGIGITLLVMSIKSMIDEGVNVENIATAISAALVSVGGIMTGIKLFNKKTAAPTPEIETATNNLEGVSNGTSKLTSKLTSLVKNLALGIVIIAEVAIAAGLFIAAIWGIGVLLEQVGIAWEPVIANGNTILIAMGIGTGVLIAVGVVTGLLGSVGASLIVALALGIAMLALLGVSAALFISEIILIGALLEQVGIAWEPVLNNGENITNAILIGTGLLVGIGVVAAALGVAAVASVGLLPLAIALGTAMLVELTWAFVEFVDSLITVADKLSNDLYPALNRLNTKLPELSSNMEDFTGFMKIFAGQVVNYTKSSAISGFASTVDSIIKFFTKDPIKSLASDANKQYKQASTLNEKLRLANPELNTTISLMKKYYIFLTEIEKLTQKINSISLSTSMLVSMENVSIPKASRIPQLATGAILPGGSPMLAWVNDQPKGQTYVEGSVENIIAAFEEFMGSRSNNTVEDNRPIILQIDGREIARATRSGSETLGRQTVSGGFAYAR